MGGNPGAVQRERSTYGRFASAVARNSTRTAASKAPRRLAASLRISSLLRVLSERMHLHMSMYF